MTPQIYLLLAQLLAVVGLLLSLFQVWRHNRQRPDARLALLPVLSLLFLSLLAAGLSLQPRTEPEVRPIPPAPITAETPPPDTEDPERIASLQRRIEELEAELTEARKPAPPPPEPEPEPAPPVQPVAAAPASAPPESIELTQVVLNALLEGSVRTLEPVSSKRFLETLNQQMVNDPFHFVNLQAAIQRRLSNGYSSTYLGSLASAQGRIHLWKIRTSDPGPDILEHLSVSSGRLNGFHFIGL